MSATSYPHFDIRLSKDYVYKMQLDRFSIFKSQDLERGCFDVLFEIDGKHLHVNKYILTSISDPMDVMLSERWSKEGEAIKIEDCSYEIFFEFLCFLYTGRCDMTTDNVFKLTDMAEFYDVPLLKDFCDKFLLSLQYTIDTIEDMTDIAQKYSLPGFLGAITTFIYRNFEGIVKYGMFNAFKKSFVEFLSACERHHKHEAEFFTAIYRWAENYVIKQKVIGDEAAFDLQEAIKAELSEILPRICFEKMEFDFLMNFVVEKGFFLSPAQICKFFNYAPKNYANGMFLKRLYALAEKQASQRQNMAPNDDFILVASVRADLAETISKIKFYDLDKTFINDFVVAKRILTEQEASHIFDTQIVIKNEERTIMGTFKDNFGIHKAVQRNDYGYNKLKQSHTKMQKFFGIKYDVPPTASTVKKMVGVEWYLCLDNRALTFKHHTMLKKNDYLLAEMRSQEVFFINPDQFTYITSSYHNI